MSLKIQQSIEGKITPMAVTNRPRMTSRLFSGSERGVQLLNTRQQQPSALKQ